jgi:folate-dependent phosphoribosylglycinamide formyltransferase PurN
MKIAVLCSPCLTTDILLGTLAAREGDSVCVLREHKLSRQAILRYRLKRFGLGKTLGQLLFMLIVPRLLSAKARARTDALLKERGLQMLSTNMLDIRDVETVNDAEVVAALRADPPDVVLVNGTRIIRSHVLDGVDAPFINVHAGITPQYRGVHGGYWALYSGDRQNFGSTIHLVDKGVDTGPVLAWNRTEPALDDTYLTYPLLQFLVALPKLMDILDGFPASVAQTEPPPEAGSSRQWFHPTIFQYLSGYFRGVS